MNVVALIASQALALVLGASVVARMIPRGPGALPAIAGYGYLLGLLLMTFILRLLSLVGVAWNFTLPALIALLCTAGLVAFNRHWPNTVAPGARTRSAVSLRVTFWLIALLLTTHIGLVAYEAIVRPLFPWDAAAQWATKARTWYVFRHMVPFVDDVTWLRSSGDVFTDAHPTYPATVPLLQTWAALAWGSWDDAIVNISWPLSLAALALAVYGQLRRLGFAPTAAIATAYGIASLPFVDAHAALAGYADLAVAAFYGLALLALAKWIRDRNHGDAILLLSSAIALPLLKAPGWAWVATLMAGIGWAVLPARVSRLLAIAAGVLATGGLLYVAVRGPLSVLGYTLSFQAAPVARPLFDNLFVFANWHLLWIIFLLLLLAERHRLFAREIGPLTAAVAAGLVFLIIVFFFSSTAEEGVEAYTTINRALLHLVPALVVYAAVLARDLWLSSAAVPVRDDTAAGMDDSDRVAFAHTT